MSHESHGANADVVSQLNEGGSSLECAPQPEPPAFALRAGYAYSGEVLALYGGIEDALHANRMHEGRSRVWRLRDGEAMTLPKLPASQAVRMSDQLVAQAKLVAAGVAAVVRPRTFGSLRRKAAPRHAHQDPKGAECLAALVSQ